MKRITMESECRYSQKKKIGDPGVEYEFNIKMPALGIDVPEDDFEADAENAIIDLTYAIKKRYHWARNWYRTGRSGGWLSFTDEDGDATKAKLQVIIGMVTKAKEKFANQLIRDYRG